MTSTLSTFIGTKKTQRGPKGTEAKKRSGKVMGQEKDSIHLHHNSSEAQLCVKKEAANGYSLSLFWPLAQLSQRRPC